MNWNWNFHFCKILEHIETITFPFGTNGKLMVLGVPELNNIRVYMLHLLRHTCTHVQVKLYVDINFCFLLNFRLVSSSVPLQSPRWLC